MILLLILDNDKIRYAVLPPKELSGYKYRNWTNAIVRTQNEPYADEVMDVFDRLGLETKRPRREQDLRRFLFDRRPNFTNVTQVVSIGWIE